MNSTEMTLSSNHNTPQTPIEQLQSLSLLEPQVNLHSLSHSIVDEFKSRRIGFNWLHLGQTKITIKQLIDHLVAQPHILPPRTGHLGNWGGILRYDAGAMDFNYPTIRNGIGRGLIYTFNQTDNAELTTGDVVYRPGSDLSGKSPKLLKLYGWDGTSFQECSNERSYFSPLMQTDVDGQLKSLVSYHTEKLFIQSDFQIESDLIYEQWPLVLKIVKHLFQSSLESENPRAEFQELIGHVVSINGQVERANITITQEGSLRRLNIGALDGLSLLELAERSVLPFMASSNPHMYFRDIVAYPTSFPVLSNTLTRILSAICHSHFATNHVNEEMITPFNPHYHWGARAMAGYPPVKRGYFSNKNKRRFTSRFCLRIIEAFPQIAPILFIILPSSIFMLQASSRIPNDAVIIDQLFKNVLEQTSDQINQPELMFITVGHLVEQWLVKYQGHISEYFLNRFRPKQGVLHRYNEHLSNSQESIPHYNPLDSDHFYALGLQQASMIVGCLHQQLAN